MPDRKGFTLIEIIVVLVIIGILAAIALPNYFTMITQGAAKTAQNNLITIYNAQKNYYLNNNSYCIAGCDTLSDINLAANLNLNITDSNFTYTCTNASGFTCTATNISNANLFLTVTGGTASAPNPIVLPGGSTCASSTGANPGCNPSCSSTNNTVYCPAS